MARRILKLTENLDQHVAVQVWNLLQGEKVSPTELEVLSRTKKSELYRFLDPRSRVSVVAKRCAKDSARLERTIYEDILPRLSLPSLELYGFSEEADSNFSWLFLQDAGDKRYSPAQEEHRKNLCRWMAFMHHEASSLDDPNLLPARGPAHYLNHLKNSCVTLERVISNTRLSREQSKLFEQIIGQCRNLELAWSYVEDMCQEMPATLVHGDVCSKNVHVLERGSTIIPFIVDWETAGWGVPAADIARVDQDAYRAEIARLWPTVSHDSVDRTMNLGRIFLWLAAIHWESLRFHPMSSEKMMFRLRACLAELASAMCSVHISQINC